jgi:hypothetical protein
MAETKKAQAPVAPQAFEPAAVPEEKLTAEEQKAKDERDANEALKERINAKGQAARLVRVKAED